MRERKEEKKKRKGLSKALGDFLTQNPLIPAGKEEEDEDLCVLWVEGERVTEMRVRERVFQLKKKETKGRERGKGKI